MRTVTRLKAISAVLVLIAIPIRANDPPVMFAHFIDVGQADATLLEFPCGAILIDAGAQDDAHVDSLVSYLDRFFQRRTDLGRTLNSIIVTHNHIDHTRALRRVAERFTVERYIDNGQLTGTGTGNPNWIRRNATTNNRNIQVREVSDSEITELPNRNGLTDAFIDPIVCQSVDSLIRILSARLDENPGWPHGIFDNKNNHSIVVRVDFGDSSFLFTGDLEEEAIDILVGYYYQEHDTGSLDVDVYQVGHHGSHNGTTTGLVEAMTPEIAVFSMGLWDFGRDPLIRFSTFAFGHPRRIVVELLSAAIQKRRSQPLTVMVANGARNFQEFRVRKKLYGTGWDGTVKIRATAAGRFRVTRSR